MILLFANTTLDQLAAAWAARHCLDRKAELVICTTPRPRLLLDMIRGKPVFSACAGLDRRELIQVSDAAASIVAIETGEVLCSDLNGFRPSGGELKLASGKSAAAEVWAHFRGKEPAPWLVAYSDPACELPNAPQIQAAMMSFGTDWDRWDEVWPLPASELLRIGDAVIRTLVDLQSEAAAMAFEGQLAGHVVPILNYPPGQATQILRSLAVSRPFAAAWVQTGTGAFRYELVSDAGIDVGELARRFRGTGDQHRAFFTTTRMIHS